MKRLLLASLLISISFLNMGLVKKPKLEALVCAEKEKLKKMSFKQKWDPYKNFNFSYDKKTGKLYWYYESLNEINPVKKLKVLNNIYTYKGKIENNTLKVVMSLKTRYNKWPDLIFLVDLNEMKNTSFFVNTPDKKKYLPCEKLSFPKGIKINY